MASYHGAFPGPHDQVKPGLEPEATRVRNDDEPAHRPQLGGGFGDVATELSAPESEPPPPMEVVPAGPRAHDDDESIPPPPPSGPVDAFAEFEGSIAGESTRIDDSDLLAEQSTAILDEGPRHPFLHVEAGKDLGKEYVLQEGETSIGRGIDNDVILSDVSVSRRHVRVLRDGDRLTLRDLGSGNGTQLNGRRAHVEPLGEGDRIELGETVLVLRIPGADIPAVEAGGQATHETVSPVSGSVPMMAGPQHYGTPQVLPPMPPPGVSTDSMMSPRDGRTQSIVLPRRMLFIAAGAVAIIGSVIGAGVVTFMGRDPDPVATGLPARVTPTPIATSTAVVPSPVVGAPPVAPAVAPIGPSATGPAAIAPVVPDATLEVPATTPEVAPVEAVAPPETVVAREPEDDEPERARSGGTRRTPGTAVVPRRGGESAEAPSGGGRGREGAIAAYRASDFRGAARLAREAASASARDRRALNQLATDIDTFGGYWPRIRSAGSNYSAVATIGANAIQLDQRIAGGHHTRAFRAGFVDWLLDDAELAFGRDPARACRRVQSASAIEASARSRGLLSRCATRATEMLAEGRRMERTDPSRARELFGAVVVIAAGTPTARDAQSRLDAIGRTRSVDEDE
jgi:hypothetical protein